MTEADKSSRQIRGSVSRRFEHQAGYCGYTRLVTEVRVVSTRPLNGNEVDALLNERINQPHWQRSAADFHVSGDRRCFSLRIVADKIPGTPRFVPESQLADWWHQEFEQA